VTRTKSFKKGTGARGTPVDEFRLTIENAEPGHENMAEEVEKNFDGVLFFDA